MSALAIAQTLGLIALGYTLGALSPPRATVLGALLVCTCAFVVVGFRIFS